MEIRSVRWKLLLFFAVVIGLSHGLKTPRHPHLEGGLSKEDLSTVELHDLDYWQNFDLGSASYEDYDDEDESSSLEVITIGSIDKTKAKESDVKQESKTDEKPDNLNPLKVTETSSSQSSKTEDKREPTTGAPPKPEVVQQANEDNEESASEEDNDGDDIVVLEKKKPEASREDLARLPSDSDVDSDKYFNPDRFREMIRLHAIEDLLNREWTVLYQDTNLPCIMLRGNIKMIVPVNPTWFNKDFVELDVPPYAEASGTCASLNNDYQEIILKWNNTIPGINITYTNSIYFAFATNWTSEFSELSIPEDKYALVSVVANYYNGEINVEDEKGDKGLRSFKVSDIKEFLTPLNRSMSCVTEKSLILEEMQLTLSNIQLEAFRPNTPILTPGEFSTSELCELDGDLRYFALINFIIWFWVAALFVVVIIFTLLLGMGYRRRQSQEEGSFHYKILTA